MKTAGLMKAVLLLVALLARLLALGAFESVDRLHGDEVYYTDTAASIARGDGHPGSLRPPLYPAFMAGVYLLAGESHDAVRIVQIGLSLLCVVLVFGVVEPRFGARAAFGSGLACALLPPLVHYPHFLWSETLNATLLALLLWLLGRFDHSPRLQWIALAGLTLGLCALTRETWLYLAPVVAVWLLARGDGHDWRGAAKTLLAFFVPLALVILPWTLRNQAQHDRFVLISTNRWFAVAAGNLYSTETWYLGSAEDRDAGYLRGESEVRAARAEARRARWQALPSHPRTPGFRDEFETEAYWKTIALERIAADQPFWLPRKILRNGARLYYANSQQLRFLGMGWVQPTRAGGYALIVSDVVGTLLVFVPGILGLWLVRDPPLKAIVAFSILLTTAVHVVAFATPRYMVPVLPLLCVYAGPLLAGALQHRPIALWRWIGGVSCVAAWLLIPLPLTIRHLEVVWAIASTLGPD